MNHRSTRGAASTETVLLLTLVPVALLLVATLFGREVQGLFRKATSNLDQARHGDESPGAPANLREEPASAPAEMDGYAYCGTPPCTPDLTSIDPAFPYDEKVRIHTILEMLPEALRSVEITDVVRVNAFNAGYHAPTRKLLIGSPLLGDGRPFRDFLVSLYDTDPGMTLERILYHEMVHAYDDQNPAVADSFLDLAYQEKYERLLADPRLPAAQQELDAAQHELAIQCEELLGTSRTWSDRMAVIERVLQDRPDLRERIHGSSQTIREILLSHRLPSRHGGDAHAGGDPGQSSESGGKEYFAIVWETARYDPEEFLRWRRLANDDDPNNDVLTPVEIRWMDEHREFLE